MTTHNGDQRGCGRGRERWCQCISPPQRHRCRAGTAEEQGQQAITPAIEDYVKTIALAQQAQHKVTTNLVADQMGVRAASVTKVFQRLQQLDMIVYVPYYGVVLTDDGQQLAMAVLRRNQLVHQFLVEMLGCSPDEARADADVLEHVISDALEQRIAAYLGCCGGDAGRGKNREGGEREDRRL